MITGDLVVVDSASQQIYDPLSSCRAEELEYVLKHTLSL